METLYKSLQMKSPKNISLQRKIEAKAERNRCLFVGQKNINDAHKRCGR